MLLGATAASIVCAILLGWLLTRSIAAPLHEMQTLTLRIAAGDLTASVPAAHGRSELAALLNNVGNMQESLRSLVSKSRQAAMSV
ncbi:HAMP domain-containing protein [uncultured Herbaspirillum sp.]|uniref:HAMP domain-containing protein n=1 Tax=uncultured Herbaspirillum sp. TaxID=160236 RepID=UPI002589CDBD|nr:HAMP domain-containing protein [uncultured Herbaspirillum sp.]